MKYYRKGRCCECGLDAYSGILIGDGTSQFVCARCLAEMMALHEMAWARGGSFNGDETIGVTAEEIPSEGKQHT